MQLGGKRWCSEALVERGNEIKYMLIEKYGVKYDDAALFALGYEMDVVKEAKALGLIADAEEAKELAKSRKVVRKYKSDGSWEKRVERYEKPIPQSQSRAKGDN